MRETLSFHTKKVLLHMTNREKKIVSLLEEGFSYHTIKKMSDTHINLLYNRLVNEEETSTVQKTTYSKQDIQSMKNKGAGLKVNNGTVTPNDDGSVTVTQEMGEDDSTALDKMANLDKYEDSNPEGNEDGPSDNMNANDGMGIFEDINEEEVLEALFGKPKMKTPITTLGMFEGELEEKSVSQQQQKIMGLALSVKRGDTPRSEVSKDVLDMVDGMTEKELEDFASTKHKGLPMKKEEFINEEDYDRMKDRQMERGTFRPRSKPYVARSGGSQPKPQKKDGPSALDIVKAEIRKKHGHGAIYEPKKKANEGYAPGDVDQKVGAVTAIPKKEQDDARARILAKTKAKRKAKLAKEEVIAERGDFWHPDPEKDKKLGGPGANQRAREDRADAAKPKEDPKKLRKGESYMDYAKRQKSYKSSGSTPTERLNKLGANIKPKKKSLLGKLGLRKEGKSFKSFLEEGNRTGRMMQKSKTQVTGHISADRGDDEKKNKEGRKNLEKDLKKHGIGHKKGVGEYKYGSGETGREVSYQTSKPDKMSKRRFGKVMRRLGRKHGQESVITKDKDKSAKLHYTEKGSKAKSDSIGKTKAGKHPEGYGETSGTKVRSQKLPKKTNKGSFHYG